MNIIKNTLPYIMSIAMVFSMSVPAMARTEENSVQADKTDIDITEETPEALSEDRETAEKTDLKENLQENTVPLREESREDIKETEVPVERKGSSDVDSSGTSRWLADYTYTAEDEYIKLTAYTGKAAEITVPGTAYINNKLYSKVVLSARMWGSNVTSLAFEKGVALPADSSYMFANPVDENSGLVSFNGTDLDTSAVTNMSFFFSGCYKLTSLDLSGFDTGRVTDMRYMFYHCNGLKSLDLSGLDTSSVTTMEGMFAWAQKLENLNLKGWDTSSVKSMKRMFYYCSGFEQLDLSCLDTGSVTDMQEMFSFCVVLKELNLQGFDTDSVTNMEGMFYFCQSMTGLNLNSFDTSSATTMYLMFYNCNQLQNLDLSGFDTSSVTNMAKMFESCSQLRYLDLSSFDMSQITSACCSCMLDLAGTGDSFRIRTPCNLTGEVSLETGNGLFYDQNGNSLTTLPQNKSASLLIVKNGKISFTSQPADVTVEAGENALFETVFDGDFDYGIWQRRKSGEAGWTDIRKETEKDSLKTLTVSVSSEWDGSSVRLVLYDAWGQEAVSNEAHLTVTGVEEKGPEDISYSFSNSRTSFGYPSGYKIPLSSYQVIYGDNTRAEAVYTAHSRSSWGGNCAGISATAALLTTSGSGLFPYTFKTGASLPKELSVSDVSSSLSMNLTKFVEAMHIAQYTVAFSNERKAHTVHSSAIRAGNANLDGLYNAIKSKASSGIPTVLALVQAGGHAVLAYKTEDISDTESRIHIYDSNFPLQDRYITLKKNGSHYNEWSYDMGSYGEWGTDADYSSISYISYATIKSIWDNRGNIGNDEANLAIVNSQNFAVYDVQGNLEAIVSEGSLSDRTGKISLIEDELSLTGGKTEDVILSLPTKTHTIVNLDRNLKTFGVNVVDTDLGVNIETTVQEVTISVDDAYNINTLVMDAGENDTYSVTLSNSFASGYDEVVVNGKGQGETLSISQSGTELNFSNCEISLLMIDGKQVGVYDIQASSTNGGRIDPQGTASVRGGDSVTYTLTANDGYEISDVFVDGDSVGPVGSYTFEKVSKSHTIMAAFRKQTAALSGTIRASLVSDASGKAVTTAPSGAKVLISAGAAGGSAPYTYKFLIYDNGAGTWYKLRDFTGTSTCTWTPGATGTKTLFVDIKDSAGTTCRAKLSGFVVTEKQTALSGTVKASLASESTGTSITTAPSGSKVLITAKGSGGSGGYTYKFLIYDNGAKTWYKFRDFTSTNTYTWTPGVTGTKTLFVDVKDSAGTTVRVKLSGFVVTEKQTALSGTVKASLAGDASGKAVTTAKSGTKVLITAKGSGGSESYTYKFLIYDNGAGAWFKLRDFTTTNTYTWTTGTTGTKTLFADIKDSAGKTVRVKLSGFVVTPK